jgi:hypothetical protein
MDEPETENPRWQGEGENETFRLINTSHLVELQARPQCKDRWIERYLEFLEELNRQSGRRPASTHCVAQAMRAYGAFCATCCPIHRQSTWQAVSAALQLFCQSQEHN